MLIFLVIFAVMKQQHYTGLTDSEVLESRERYGANILSEPEKIPLWKRFLTKFKDPLFTNIIYWVRGVLFFLSQLVSL